jgi:hypothetical protein
VSKANFLRYNLLIQKTSLQHTVSAEFPWLAMLYTITIIKAFLNINLNIDKINTDLYIRNFIGLEEG